MKTLILWKVQLSNNCGPPDVYGIFETKTEAEAFKEQMSFSKFWHMFTPDKLEVTSEELRIAEDADEAQRWFMENFYYSKEEWQEELRRIRRVFHS